MRYWITLADKGQLGFLAAASRAASLLELRHARLHPYPCPCRDAYSTGVWVRVIDIRAETTMWPEFSTSAAILSIAGVAAIPMRLVDQVVGALNLYSLEPRDWSDEDMTVASMLADIATSYLVNASTLRQQEQLSEQLPEILRSPVMPFHGRGQKVGTRRVKGRD